jgi:hypothetical protein
VNLTEFLVSRVEGVEGRRGFGGEERVLDASVLGVVRRSGDCAEGDSGASGEFLESSLLT